MSYIFKNVTIDKDVCVLILYFYHKLGNALFFIVLISYIYYYRYEELYDCNVTTGTRTV